MATSCEGPWATTTNSLGQCSAPRERSCWLKRNSSSTLRLNGVRALPTLHPTVRDTIRKAVAAGDNDDETPPLHPPFALALDHLDNDSSIAGASEERSQSAEVQMAQIRWDVRARPKAERRRDTRLHGSRTVIQLLPPRDATSPPIPALLDAGQLISTSIHAGDSFPLASFLDGGVHCGKGHRRSRQRGQHGSLGTCRTRLRMDRRDGRQHEARVDLRRRANVRDADERGGRQQRGRQSLAGIMASVRAPSLLLLAVVLRSVSAYPIPSAFSADAGRQAARLTQRRRASLCPHLSIYTTHHPCTSTYTAMISSPTAKIRSIHDAAADPTTAPYDSRSADDESRMHTRPSWRGTCTHVRVSQTPQSCTTMHKDIQPKRVTTEPAAPQTVNAVRPRPRPRSRRHFSRIADGMGNVWVRFDDADPTMAPCEPNLAHAHSPRCFRRRNRSAVSAGTGSPSISMRSTAGVGHDGSRLGRQSRYVQEQKLQRNGNVNTYIQ